MIQPLDDQEVLQEAFFDVFSDTDPFEVFGQPGLPVKALLYPTDLYYLNEPQFSALTAALAVEKESKFYISFTELKDHPFTAGGEEQEIANWECDNLTFEEYRSLDLFMEKALYSTRGTWGILLSHESHAVLASSKSFWDQFSKYYENWEQDKANFSELWSGYEAMRNTDISWLSPLLDHLTV